MHDSSFAFVQAVFHVILFIVLHGSSRSRKRARPLSGISVKPRARVLRPPTKTQVKLQT